jgi:NADH-quinone oxidoreductase subunit N
VIDHASQSLIDALPLLMPEIVLAVTACLLFVGATVRAGRRIWATLALAGLVGAGLALLYFPRPFTLTPSEQLYYAPFVLDPLATLTKTIAIVGGIVLVLLSWNELPARNAAEYYGCLLFIVAGLCLAGAANELVTLFLGLELISIPTYVLLYLPRFDSASQEAAMKYFLLSVFSSGLLLFGFSYLYGAGGTTNLPMLLETISRLDATGRWAAVILVAVIMVVAGLGFRITAVPFHYYAPDVYQGAPTSGAALLAFVPKVAGFVAIIRVLGFVRSNNPDSAPILADQTAVLFWILAAVTMFSGNVLALLQNNVKRLLAYSSVAHAGYMLVGLAVAYHLARAAPPNQAPAGVAAVLFYLVAYSAMTGGAFAILAYLSTPERPVETEDDLAGLSESHPGIALLMAVFLFSLIGIPLTAGFMGKLFLVTGALAVDEPHSTAYRWLALILVINAAIGGWYYLRILAKMYLYSSARPIRRPISWPGLCALWLCAAVTLVFGLYPKLLYDEVRRVSMPAGSHNTLRAFSNAPATSP